jgi:6-phosphogluconolactonase/glucosamine-6-phosphate isomerase/deaminase
MSAVSVTPELLATIAEVLFVVAGADKHDALAALAGGDPSLIAWRAIQGCPAAQLWLHESD